MMRAIGFGLTDVGCKRSRNEDCLAVDNELGVFAVSDGMGGHASGDVASRMAIDGLMERIADKRELLAQARDGRRSVTVVARLLDAAVQQTAYDIHQAGMLDAAHEGMGCTLTVVVTVGSRAVIAHIGDSRVMLLREGTLRQITRDHTLAAELGASGVLTAEQAARSPFAHVLSRSIGSDAHVAPDILVVALRPGDRILLCSDGLTRYITDVQAFGRKLRGDLAALPGRLIGWAKASGGDDNISAVVVAVFDSLHEAVGETLAAERRGAAFGAASASAHG